MAYPTATVNTYKEVNINTASQGKLILMLFDGAIKRAEESIRQLERNNIESVHRNLIRAQEIIAELRSSLNREVGGEIAINLDRIYEYIYYLLVQGNLKKEAKSIRESIEHMRSMRDTWKEAFEIYQKEEQEQESAPNTMTRETVDVSSTSSFNFSI